jgi:histidinol phosphatase-like enzyme
VLKVIIWDNDGTIMGSKDPNDKSNTAKVILPNVREVMNLSGIVNIICSGIKTPESESQNFDPEGVANKFKNMMNDLPIKAAAFYSLIGGVACYVVLKKNDSFEIRKAHEDQKYANHIGEFKKPGIGMLMVIKDLVKNELGMNITNPNEVIFIGDTWHDREAATKVGIPFMHAETVHNVKNEHDFIEQYKKLTNLNLQKGVFFSL